jgi:fructose-1,6-bisphosphatase I
VQICILPGAARGTGQPVVLLLNFGRTGLAGKSNVQGEQVKKLDVIANEIFINSLQSSGKVNVMVSEENENEIIVEDKALRGKYSVVFDPLDGSSNIDSGVSIGTIFGIYHCEGDGNEKAVLKPGKEMVAAGYALYGSFTVLVLSTGNGVNGYTLDPNLGEFILTNPNVYLLTKSRFKRPKREKYIPSMRGIRSFGMPVPRPILTR